MCKRVFVGLKGFVWMRDEGVVVGGMRESGRGMSCMGVTSRVRECVECIVDMWVSEFIVGGRNDLWA